LSKDTSEVIIEYLSGVAELQARPTLAGRRAVPLQTKVLMMLWYLASKDTIRQIADRFNVSESTCVSQIRQVVNAVVTDVLPRVLSWPSTGEQNEVVRIFEEKWGFPGVVGAIDGTHIKIKAPFQHSENYFNRKGYHSIVLQATCKYDMSFTDVYCGWPGRVHDARVLRNSPLSHRCYELCGVNHLIGDGGYPIKPWLLTPYRDNGHLTRDEVKFNKSLSRARSVIERAFGMLKGRFRRLQHIDVHSIENINKVILAACTLHNVCILNADELEDSFLEQDEPNEYPGQDNIPRNDAEGALKRILLTRQFAAARQARQPDQRHY
jgi:hypothetical protein